MSRKKKEDIVVRDIVAQSTGTVKPSEPPAISGGTPRGQQDPTTKPTKPTIDLTLSTSSLTAQGSESIFGLGTSTGTAKPQNPTFTVEPGAGANTARNQQNVSPSENVSSKKKKPP